MGTGKVAIGRASIRVYRSQYSKNGRVEEDSPRTIWELAKLDEDIV